MPSTTFSAQLRAWCTRSRPSGDRPYVSAAQPTKRAPRQNSFVCAVAAPSEVSVESTTSTNVQDDRITQDDWDRFTAAYTSQYEEHAFFADASSVEGEIPKELCGTLLRNGPALYEIGGKSIPQPFDGDGMVAVFAFPGEGKPPYFANRFVRTKAFVEEQEAGKMLYRGAFSVGNPAGGWLYNPFDLSIKKVANTGVVRWASRLLALYERDLPYQLTTPDLRTVGPTDCDGAIDGPFFAAHYRIFVEEDGSRRLVGFNSAEKGLDNEVTVWEFDEAGKQLHRSSLTLPDAAFAFLHDFAMTERHYIFLENPVRMNLGKLLTKYMFGKACIAECLQYDPSRPTKVHVLPRPERGAPPGSDGHRVYQTPSPFFSFHHANAFVSPDGHIVVDTVALHDGMDFSANLDIGATYYDDDVGRGTLTRLVLSPWSGGVAQHRMLARACEFPSVAPCQVGRPATHTYMVGARFDSERAWGPPEVVVKTSIDPGAGVGRALDAAREVTQRVYSPGEGRWAGEPIFVPRPVSEGVSSAEDDGWVLVMVFDSTTRKSELVILDARDMSVTATVKLPLMLPAGLHGSWTKEYLGFAPHTSFQPKKYDIRSGASKYE